MSNCWAWGVQQRLAASDCAEHVTALARCCREANLDSREKLNTRRKMNEEGDAPCDLELDVVRRCLPAALLGGSGRPFEACEKDFRAVATLPADADEQRVGTVLNRGWACAWRAFRQPVEQLVAQAQAVGECRPAAPVKNTAGKGRWTT
eukprot:s827_g20.t1